MGDELQNEIKLSLSINSKFSYYPGCEVVGNTKNHVATKEDTQMYYAKGQLTLDHAFILRAINVVGHANIAMIKQILTLMKRQYPEKEIPVYTEKEYTNNLEKLMRAGLVYGSVYKTKEDNKIIIFTVTLQGYVFYKNRLEVVDSYDDAAFFHGDHEVFKRMACNSVALALSLDEYCVDCCINGRYSYAIQPKKFNGYVYAAVEFSYEDIKKLFIIEPTYFNIDHRISTDEEEAVKIDNRLTKLGKIIDTYKETNKVDVVPVFCVEGMSSLSKLGNLLVKRFDTIGDVALITSESIMYRNKYNLDRSFLAFNFKDGKKLIKPVASKWR